jgi:predicted CoA-binding protein
MRGKTLVMGANDNPEKYAYKCATGLISRGHSVVLFGHKEGEVMGEKIITSLPDQIKDLETVTLYLGPARQKEYYAKILALKPKRVLFNPGTENPEFEQMCEETGIEAQEVCSLVMLSTGTY